MKQIDGASIAQKVHEETRQRIAALTARGTRELRFTVQADTIFELDGARFHVLNVQPAVEKNIGWVEIDAAPTR